MASIMQKLFPATNLVANARHTLVFKTTHWCWYKCAHCCENSGPDRPREYIPAPIINSYIDQAKSNPDFRNGVVFTGGEIMSAYRADVGGEYVRSILNHALDAGFGVNMKTNAGWVGTTFGNEIFDDIKRITHAHKKYQMQISLSLDSYHPNAADKNRRLITRMARQKCPIAIDIVTFTESDRSAMENILSRLSREHIYINPLSFGTYDDMRQGVLLNNSVLLTHTESSLCANGRGANLPGASVDPTPQFSIAHQGTQSILMAFDAAGNVTLGEAGARKITVKWRDKNGAPRPLADIHNDFIWATMREEIRYFLTHGHGVCTAR